MRSIQGASSLTFELDLSYRDFKALWSDFKRFAVSVDCPVKVVGDLAFRSECGRRQVRLSKGKPLTIAIIASNNQLPKAFREKCEAILRRWEQEGSLSSQEMS